MLLTIEPRFNGPDGSANGGYVCGLVARHLGSNAHCTTVRLRAKPPLGVPLRLQRDDTTAQLHANDVVVATARAGMLPDAVALPAAPSLEQARTAERGETDLCQHASPNCFVCGPRRAAGDGLRLFPGPILNSQVVACTWTPGAQYADASGVVTPEFVWSALDCPSFWGLRVAFDRLYLLGEMTAQQLRPLPAEQTVVVYGWRRGGEGRKHYAAAAIASSDGQLIAHAEHIWIEPRA